MTRSHAVTTYTPEAEIRRPGLLLRNMMRDLGNSRELAWRLAQRDIKAQYRQSYLGYLWAFIIPLATTVTWVYLNVAGVVRVEDTTIPYPVYVFTGTMLWQVLVEAVQSPLQQVGMARGMITKLNFPREAVVLSGLIKVSSNVGIKLLLLVPAVLLLGVKPDMHVLLLPIGLAALVVFGMAVGLLLAPIGMLYSDIAKGIPLVAQFVMYLTPVVFAVPSNGWLAAICNWNPATPLIMTARSWLTGSSSPMIGYFIVVFCASLLLLFVSWLIYRITIPVLIERMGS